MSWKACVSQNVLSLLCSRVCVVSARWLTAVKSPRLQRVPLQRLSDSCLHPCCCCWCWWWGQREGGKKKGDLLPPRTPHNASTRWLFICWRMWRDGAGAGQCDIKWWWGSGTVAARTAGQRRSCASSAAVCRRRAPLFALDVRNQSFELCRGFS